MIVKYSVHFKKVPEYEHEPAYLRADYLATTRTEPEAASFLSSIYLSFEIKVALFRVLSLSVSELVDGQKWKEKDNRLCKV